MIQVVRFDRPLPANGPINWGEHFRDVVNSRGWETLAPRIHFIGSGPTGVIAKITAMSDGRGRVAPLIHGGDAISHEFGSLPVYWDMGEIPIGPEPGEMTSYPLPAMPEAGLSAMKSVGDMCLAGVVRWTPGYPSN